MTSNPQEIIQDIRTEFEMILEYVTGDKAQVSTAYQIECGLLKHLLNMGRQLLLLFFMMRSRNASRDPIVMEDGQELPHHDEKERTYFSIFGKLPLERPYFYCRGKGGQILLDAELSLGSDQYSDLLRDMAEHLGVYMAYNKSANILKRFLGLSLSTRVFEKMMAEDSQDVEAYYEQKPAPKPDTEAEILVIQADGKGVPLILEAPAEPQVRLGKGQKRGKKKEAIVTSVYTIGRAPRTPKEVVDSFFKQETDISVRKTISKRPKPQNKHVWATLAGKDAALDRLMKYVAPRLGSHIADKVALCDGCEALQERIESRFSDFSLILDFVHANEYLWKVANRLLGESDPRRTEWVAEKTLLMLSGKTQQIIAEFLQLAEERKRTKPQQEILTKTANYFDRNLPYMDYPSYLANGWPIASGVIEGACRHLVKDRMELSGMRWSLEGAESLLRLRAVAENDDWDAYHRFRMKQRHQRLHGTPFPNQTLFAQTLSTFPSNRSTSDRETVSATAPPSNSSRYCQLPLAV
jgi:hypothetical protein